MSTDFGRMVVSEALAAGLERQSSVVLHDSRTAISRYPLDDSPDSPDVGILVGEEFTVPTPPGDACRKWPPARRAQQTLQPPRPRAWMAWLVGTRNGCKNSIIPRRGGGARSSLRPVTVVPCTLPSWPQKQAVRSPVSLLSRHQPLDARLPLLVLLQVVAREPEISP
jgi:hypothetical protein